MPTVSTEEKPDARLATEAELKQFIDEVHPEDIDIESPEFRALPTEVQYEIVGDMRVRSRQTSHKRLADMLRAAPSALDFSMAQIKNLSQRNALTQQLLTVTDMVGQAHLTIPVRIAAERNREYVLVKRDETQGGGWALGIREGSKQKPIEIEDKDEKPGHRRGHDSESDSDYDSDDESEIEEIAPPTAPVQLSRQTTDPDLKEHRRREILEAIAARYAPQKAPRASLDVEAKSFGKARQPGAIPLFDSTEDDEIENEVVPSANDEALALALQQEELGSDEEEADLDLARALALSRKDAEAGGNARQASVSAKSEDSDDSFEEVSLDPSRVPTPQVLSQQSTPIVIDEDDEDDDLAEVEGPLAPSTLPSSKARENNHTATRLKQVSTQAHPKAPPSSAPLRAAEPSTTTAQLESNNASLQTHVVKQAADLDEVDRRLRAQVIPAVSAAAPGEAEPRVDRQVDKEESEDDFVEVLPTPPTNVDSKAQTLRPAAPSNSADSRPVETTEDLVMSSGKSTSVRPTARSEAPSMVAAPGASTAASRPALHRSISSHRASPALSRASPARSISRTPAREAEPDDPDNLTNSLLGIRAERPVDRHSYMEMAEESIPSSHQGSAYDGDEANESEKEKDEDDEDDEDRIDWSRSASPVSRPPLQSARSGETIPSEVEDEDEDMAPAEMVAEQDDYARFMASIRNRDLNEVRTEIDDEIRILNNQNKVAMRDSDEITLAMVSQIQVSHRVASCRILRHQLTI
jgi:DNA excision repair protein ERCC-5